MSAFLVEKPKAFPARAEMRAAALALLRTKHHGDVVTYRELSGVVTVDAQSERGRSAILRAGRTLLLDQDRLLINVRGVGYRVAHPGEHSGESKRLQKHAVRRLNRALATVVHVAMQAMSPEERARTIQEQVRAGLMLGVSRRLTKTRTLPAAPIRALPSGAQLVALSTKKREAG